VGLALRLKEFSLPYQVLMVAPTSFFADYGCHVRILAEVTNLQHLGHRVIICTYHNGDDVQGLDIRRGWGPPWIQRPVVGSSRHKIYLDAMLLWRTLLVAIRERPDVIHAHLHEGAFIGTIVGRLLGLPVLFDFQGSMTAEMVDHRFLTRGSFWYRPLRWLEEHIIRWPQAVATSSYNAARVLREEFNFPEGHLLTVPDGVNTANFQPLDDVPGWPQRRARLRAELGIPADARVVVYLGLLAPYQGTDVLLQAARLVLQDVPDVYFLVMGFPGVESYAALAGSLGILDHTLFPGRISYFEAPRGLALGDVAVAPKMSATEGSGKILDYMAMALPVVAFDTPVSREMLGALGLYAEYGSAASLAQCLVRALRDVEGGRALGYRLRERAEAVFSWAQGIERLVELYARLGARESLPPAGGAPCIGPHDGL
jgi:glycosyltransferase involved in cell wall biosynthesis